VRAQQREARDRGSQLHVSSLRRGHLGSREDL
jgi:hypothetical protein